jgi:hypothetical protein
VTVQIRSAAAVPSAAGGTSHEATEPFRDKHLSRRRGYDEWFLGIPVPVPVVLDESVSRLDDGSHLLPYEHFSVIMHKLRRLAC